MQISKSDPKIKQETYTKYDENKEIDFNSNINLEFKKVKQNEKPLVEDSKTTRKTYSPLLRQVHFFHKVLVGLTLIKCMFSFVQIIASSGPILATVAAGKTYFYNLCNIHSFSL